MKYSREHTTHGHSEYQEALIKEFDERGLTVQMVNAVFSTVTIVANPETHLAVTIVHTDQSGGSIEGFCETMNKFFGRAYLFHFGTDFDGAVEE